MIKIILKKNINNLGKKFDVISVKSGYALNYLIPNKYAIIATRPNIKINNEATKQIEKKTKLLIEKYYNYINLLKEKELIFKFNITESKYFIINKAIVLNKLRNYNIEIKKKDLKLNRTIIKSYGEYKINIKLLNKLEGYIKIILVKTK